jgi:hypothetical protein
MKRDPALLACIANHATGPLDPIGSNVRRAIADKRRLNVAGVPSVLVREIDGSIGVFVLAFDVEQALTALGNVDSEEAKAS